MKEVKYIKIQGFDFIITKEFTLNNNSYKIAIDEKGENTICILKSEIVNGKEIVKSVTDEEELEMIIEFLKRENNN